MSQIKIEGNTKEATSAVNEVITATTTLDNEMKKLNTTSSITNEKLIADTKKVADAQKSLADKIRSVATSMMKSITGTESFMESKAMIDLVKDSYSGLVNTIMSYKDLIMEMEDKATKKTALKLLSEDGDDLNQVLSRTLEITRGVAGGGAIMNQVNTLMTQGFNLTSESLERLIDVSGIYSSTTGQDMNSVMQKLAMGSQRERDATFEKLGVNIRVNDELARYSREIGKSVALMTESEKSTRLLNVATESLKTKFAETGLSAMSLESPMTTMFNNWSANVKKVKYEIVSFLSEIAGGILQAEREKAGNSMAYYQQKFNELLMITQAQERKITEEILLQESVKGRDISKEDMDYYMGLYKLRQKDRNNVTFISKEKLQILAETAEKEFEIEGKKSTMYASNALERANIERKNNERRDEIWTKHAKKMLTDEEMWFLGFLQKKNEGYAVAAMNYKNKLENDEKIALEHQIELDRLEMLGLVNRDQMQKDLEEKGKEQAIADAEKRMEEYKKKEEQQKQWKKDSEEAIRINKETSDIINKNKIESLTDTVKKEELKYQQLQDQISKYSTDTTESKILHNAKMSKLQAELATQELAVNKARLAQSEEYFGEDGLLNKVQKDGAEKDKADNKKILEDKMADIGIKYELIKSQKELEGNEQQAIIDLETKTFEKRLAIAKDYYSKIGNMVFEGLTSKRVLEDEKIDEANKANKDAYEKEEITLEEFEANKKKIREEAAGYNKRLLQEIISTNMQRAGSEIFNDGLAGLWKGGRMAFGYPSEKAQAPALIAFSLAEMGAGLTLGYQGAKLAPKASNYGLNDKSKDEAAKDKNSTMKDNKMISKVNTYLFPSERDWLMQLQKSQTRLNG